LKYSSLEKSSQIQLWAFIVAHGDGNSGDNYASVRSTILPIISCRSKRKGRGKTEGSRYKVIEKWWRKNSINYQ